MATEPSGEPPHASESWIRSVDDNGRVILPGAFANSMIEIVEMDEFEMRIRKVVAVPAREMWLQRNPEALESVLTGLQQAKARDFVDGPDVSADLSALGADEDDHAV